MNTNDLLELILEELKKLNKVINKEIDEDG